MPKKSKPSPIRAAVPDIAIRRLGREAWDTCEVVMTLPNGGSEVMMVCPRLSHRPEGATVLGYDVRQTGFSRMTADEAEAYCRQLKVALTEARRLDKAYGGKFISY